MPKLSSHYAFLALTLWLLSNWAGAHGHFCFDGQEPPISVHMHLDGYEVHDHHADEMHDHHPDEVHQDADIELTQSALTKLSKIDLGLILLAALALALLIPPTPVFISAYRTFYPPISLYWRPLLRAPPVSV
jgi:hypothetical protein